MKKIIKLTENDLHKIIRKCVNESLSEQEHQSRYGYPPTSEQEMDDFYWRNGPAGRYTMDYQGYDEDGCGGNFYGGGGAEEYDVPQHIKDEEWKYFPDGENNLMEAKINKIVRNSIKKYLK